MTQGRNIQVKMTFSIKTGAFCLFLTFSAFSIEKTSQTKCLLYRYKSTSYYDYFYERKKYQMVSSSFYKYCSSSCCYGVCCPDISYYSYYYYHNAITAGAIAGIVIGSLIGLAILISIIVACCIGCRRRQSQPGHIVTAGGPNVSYIHATQTTVPGQVVVGATYPQYPHGVQPQGYIYPTTGVGSYAVTGSGSPSTAGTTNTGFKPDTAAPPPPYQ